MIKGGEGLATVLCNIFSFLMIFFILFLKVCRVIYREGAKYKQFKHAKIGGTPRRIRLKIILPPTRKKLHFSLQIYDVTIRQLNYTKFSN
jgi:hypothetical protein